MRAWEDNSSTAHSSTSRLPNSNQKHQMPTTHSGQTANSTILPPHDRTLPSLSSVFESNSITSASNRPLLFYDPGNSNSPEIKTPAAPDQGVKRPRLSQNEGRKSEVDIPRGSTLGPVPVSPLLRFIARLPLLSRLQLKRNQLIRIESGIIIILPKEAANHLLKAGHNALPVLEHGTS